MSDVRDLSQDVLQVAQRRRAVRARRVVAQDSVGRHDAERDTDPRRRALLTIAITAPTLGCRQYADRLADPGFDVSKSTVQNLLVAHGLGRRAQRLARAAAIAALTTGLVTEARRR